MDTPWELPNDWHWSTLGAETKVIGGGTPTSSEQSYFGGDIAWLTPADLSGYTAKLIAKGARSLTKEGFQNCGARLMPKGTVLFSSRAPIGYVAIASNEIATNQGFKSLIPCATLEPDYLYYWLQRAKEFAVRVASGTTFLEISGKAMAELPVPIPPLPTQHRIVQAIEEKLSRLDAAQSALLRAQANLKRYRELTVLEAVTGGRESLSKTWSPDDSPTLPAGWRWEPLAALSKLTGGLAKSSSRKTVQARRLVPYLRVANVQRGYLDLQEIKEIEATESEIKDLRLEHHDVLFNEGGDRDKLGRGWLWESQIPEAIHQNHVFRTRADRTQVLPLFLSYCGNSYGAAWFWKHGKQTTNLASISLRVLRAFPVALPPLETQQKIVAHLERQLSVIDRTEQSLQTQLARAKRLRQSILQQAFAPLG